MMQIRSGYSRISFAGLILPCILSLLNAQEASFPQVELPSQNQMASQNFTQQFTTAPQCRCSDIDKCSKEMFEKTNKCKVDPRCETFIKNIGNPDKIRACLDNEHDDMQKLETCVKKKIGPLGCSMDENPDNLTIPLIPVIEAPEVFETEAEEIEETPMAAPPQTGAGPPELTQFLMCVDQCSMATLEAESFKQTRAKRSPINCAFKLRCALSPPDENVQKAFIECEKELDIEPMKRFKTSCNCLKNAGVASIQCPP